MLAQPQGFRCSRAQQAGEGPLAVFECRAQQAVAVEIQQVEQVILQFAAALVAEGVLQHLEVVLPSALQATISPSRLPA